MLPLYLSRAPFILQDAPHSRTFYASRVFFTQPLQYSPAFHKFPRVPDVVDWSAFDVVITVEAVVFLMDDDCNAESFCSGENLQFSSSGLSSREQSRESCQIECLCRTRRSPKQVVQLTGVKKGG